MLVGFDWNWGVRIHDYDLRGLSVVRYAVGQRGIT